MSRLVRRSLRGLGLGFALVLAAMPARAEAPTDLYADTLARIETLYLRPEQLMAESFFVAAVTELERDLEWLMVDVRGPTATLRVGDGAVLGSVTVSGWSGLAPALREVERLVRSASPRQEVGEVDVQLSLLRGITGGLDRHSVLLYGERLAAFDKRLKGTFEGVGATLSLDGDNRLTLKEVFPDNPAAKAGLEPGDVLLRIDGVSTTGMTVEDAVERITGPKGTVVQLTVLRAGEELNYSVTRDEVREVNVSWRSLGNGFGYIRIDHFSEQTEIYLDQALVALDERGALERGLVLDLRNNLGGSMAQSAATADRFLNQGEVVRTVGRNGGKVAGLVQSISAVDDGTEPEIPIVVLQNQRSASGAEIVAGSLRELERAVLIGTRSYGKGTVQKVYPLSRQGVRLKLTVAEYKLPGGLSIVDDGGLNADLPIGKVIFDANGVRFTNDLPTTTGPEPLLFVEERAGWRDAPAPPSREDDPWIELALRVLAMSTGWEREELLAAAGEVRELVRAEEEQRLIEAFAARGIDWSPAANSGGPMPIKVTIGPAEPAVSGKPVRLVARVTNTGSVPLYRVMVRLDSNDPTWDDRVLPVGMIAPGAEVVGEVVVPVEPGLPTRESLVDAVVQADGRPEYDASTWILSTEGADVPPLQLQVRMVPEGDHYRADITAKNLGSRNLIDLRFRFEYPSDAAVELLEYDTGLPALGAGASGRVSLGVRTSAAGASLPLALVVEAKDYGGLLDWPVELPLDGRVVTLQAPAISAGGPGKNAASGEAVLRVRASDDAGLDHVVVWAGDDKVAWSSAAGKRVELNVSVPVKPGTNAYYVEATDTQGLSALRVVYVRGIEEPGMAGQA